MSPVTRSRPVQRIITAGGRLIAFSLVLAGLWGCALLQQQPAPVIKIYITATPRFTQAPPVAPGGGLAPQPTYTPDPTYTPLPTYTPYPTEPPPVASTALPAHATPVLIQPVGYATPGSYDQPAGKCCTLRVRNQASHKLWIGTNPPYGGNTIQPLWYIEFYLSQPGTLRVYWCDHGYFDEDPYGCQHRDVDVPEGLTEINVN